MSFVVIDVGNSRMKWGLANWEEILDVAFLPLDDPAAWSALLRNWRQIEPDLSPVRLAGSNPPVIAKVEAWLQHDGQTVRRLTTYREIPLQLDVRHPETVGLDRLFNALAVSARLHHQRPAIVVSAGSAVTVDLVNVGGIFRGGAIFPGLTLMAKSLRDYTAQLPLVEIAETNPPMPGDATVPALVAGIHGASVGGILYLVNRLRLAFASASGFGSSPTPSKPEALAKGVEPEANGDPRCYLTGGDAQLLAPALGDAFTPWPWMTLEGIRLSSLHNS